MTLSTVESRQLYRLYRMRERARKLKRAISDAVQDPASWRLAKLEKDATALCEMLARYFIEPDVNDEGDQH